jgi:hypothetical protein
MDRDVLTLFVPCDVRWRDVDAHDFALHLLTALFLEWWQKAYKRRRSDLLRLATMGEHSVLDDLRRDQQHFVQLYRILHARRMDIQRQHSSVLGASALARAELKRDEVRSSHEAP